MDTKTATIENKFTRYQALVIVLIAFTQFTVVLDFMVMSPLGDMLMKSMELTTSQFGFAVSGYAFSAGISGLLTAGFADRFDRKKLLLFFYVGFIAGTLFCGLANSYVMLIAARIITGLFGGVIGSISMASTSTSAKPKTARRVPKIDPVDGKLISPYTLAERTALSRQDCKPNNLHKDGLGIHGHYRTYGQWDPELKSIEGRKQYEACVKRGLDPTPWFAFGQRLLIATRGQWFGKTKESCLTCHSKY